MTDFLAVVVYEVSRASFCSSSLEKESAEHAESWSTKYIDLEILVLFVEVKFTFPDDIGCFIPDESIVNDTTFFIDSLLIFVGGSVQ